MAITIDKISAEIICALAIEDLRGYSKRYPEAHAAYLAAKKKQEQQQAENPPAKIRRSA